MPVIALVSLADAIAALAQKQSKNRNFIRETKINRLRLKNKRIHEGCGEVAIPEILIGHNLSLQRN